MLALSDSVPTGSTATVSSGGATVPSAVRRKIVFHETPPFCKEPFQLISYLTYQVKQEVFESLDLQVAVTLHNVEIEI